LSCLRILSFARDQGRTWPGAGAYSVKFPRTRTITACVSIYVDTSATFTASEAWPAKDDFALLKALCLPRGKRLSNRNGLATGTVPYIQRLLLWVGTLVRTTEPSGASTEFGTLRRLTAW